MYHLRMTYSHIIAIDQGTHSTRAIIYDEYGQELFRSKQPLGLNYVKTHHVEQDGTAILQSCRQVLNDSHQYIQQHQLENVAVALTTQRSTVIGWHAQTGEALSPALSWLDTRAQNELKALQLNEQEVSAKTGLQISAHYGASKLRWLLDHNEKVREARQQNNLLMGPLAAYLVFNLLDNHSTYVDYANAHRTLLWNIHSLDWDDALLDKFSVARELLPSPVPNVFAYGKLAHVGHPLVMMNGDQNAAVYGYAQRQDDTILVNVGTGGFVLSRSDVLPENQSNLLSTIINSTDSQKEFAIEGTINGAGAALSWAREHWQMGNIIDMDWKHTSDVPVFINTVGGLGSPWWQGDRKPAFLQAGKTFADYTPEQCKAALMESIVFLIVNNLEVMQKLNIKQKRLLVSGGFTKDVHFCQRLADTSGLPVIISSYEETTSRGAAWLAFGQPDWDLPLGDAIQPNADQALMMRYQQFTEAIKQNDFKHRLIAHRGDRTSYPENSLMAIQTALDLGYSFVEIDVQLSKDKVSMVIHDDNLLRTVGVNKKVCELTAQQLGSYTLLDSAQSNADKTHLQIPTLSATVETVNNHPGSTLFVEIKRQSIAQFGLQTVIDAVLESLRNAKFNIVIISFIADAIVYLQSLKEYPVGWVLREYNEASRQQAEQMQPDYLFCSMNKIGPPKSLWHGHWQWALYDVDEPAKARDLLAQEVTLVEIDDIILFAKASALQ